LQQGQNLIAVPDEPAGQLSDYESVTNDFTLQEQRRQFSMPVPQVLDPYRCIDQNHLSRSCPSPWNRPQLFFSSAQLGKPLCAFRGDECLQAQSNEGSFLGNARQLRRLVDQVVFDIQRRSHQHLAYMRFYMSIYALFICQGQAPPINLRRVKCVIRERRPQLRFAQPVVHLLQLGVVFAGLFEGGGDLPNVDSGSGHARTAAGRSIRKNDPRTVQCLNNYNNQKSKNKQITMNKFKNSKPSGKS